MYAVRGVVLWDSWLINAGKTGRSSQELVAIGDSVWAFWRHSQTGQLGTTWNNRAYRAYPECWCEGLVCTSLQYFVLNDAFQLLVFKFLILCWTVQGAFHGDCGLLVCSSLLVIYDMIYWDMYIYHISIYIHIYIYTVHVLFVVLTCFAVASFSARTLLGSPEDSGEHLFQSCESWIWAGVQFVWFKFPWILSFWGLFEKDEKGGVC